MKLKGDWVCKEFQNLLVFFRKVNKGFLYKLGYNYIEMIVCRIL